MTDLLRRGVRRETCTAEPCKGRRPLVILLEQGGHLVRIKPKGTRKWYSVTYAQIYRLGIHNRAAEIRQEKQERRDARKAGRTP
jgi:hypothetical protein